MASNDLLIDKHPPIGFITFNRPAKKNSFTPAMLALFERTVEAWEADPEIRVIILRGTEDTFSVGADALALQEGGFDAREHIHQYRRYAECGKPTLASVNGLALGGGAELALMSDVTIASERASFGFTGPRLGAVCSFANVRLAEEIGRAAAKELLLTCDVIDAATAIRIGLVNHVVAHHELTSATLTMADKLSRAAPLAVKHIKVGTNRQLGGWDLMVEALTEVLASEDLREGVQAFRERRPPRFRGM